MYETPIQSARGAHLARHGPFTFYIHNTARGDSPRAVCLDVSRRSYLSPSGVVIPPFVSTAILVFVIVLVFVVIAVIIVIVVVIVIV